MTTSAQLERQSELQRAQLMETLDELRSRMTPGQVVDQLTDYVQEGTGGTFFRNFRTQCMANPVPTTLIGAGLAWFMFSSWRGKPKQAGRVKGAPRDSTPAPDAAAKWGRRFASKGDDAYGAVKQYGERDARAPDEGVSRSARDLRDKVSDVAAAGYEKAAAGYDTIADTASSAYEGAATQARDAAESISQKASDMRGTVNRTADKISTVLREQPLVLAGLGLAVGALLGAVLPTTETEDKVMGSASDELKEKVSSVASETVEKGKTVAEHAWNEAREEAANQGLLPLDKAVNDAIDKVAEGQGRSEPSLVPHSQDSGEQVRGGA